MGLKALMPWALEGRIRSELSSGGKFKKFSYPSGALDAFKLVQFENRLSDGTNCFGLGCARDEKSASLKAFYEYLERKAFYEHGISKGFRTTNGIAIHKFKSLAVHAAFSELAERDAFLMHWYGQVPFKILQQERYRFLDAPVEQLELLGFRTHIVETVLGISSTFATFLIDIETGGFAIGTSSGKTLINDIEKSFTEACTNLFLVEAVDDLASFNRISDFGIKRLEDHRAFWLSISSLPDWVMQNLVCLTSKITRLRKAPEIELLTNEFMPVVAIKSDSLLPLRIGNPTIEDYRLLSGRLQDFEISVPNYSDLLLHPIP